MPVYRVLNEQIGKKTHGNPVTLPRGTAITLKNYECTRDNVYKKPRGRESFATGLPAQDVKQFFEYNNKLFCHMGNNTVYYQNTATAFLQQTDDSGGSTYSQPDSLNKIQSLESNSNLYFTSSAGVYVLDVLGGTTKKAGVPKAIGFDVSIINNVNWLPTATSVAYRVLFTYLDANDNLIVGAPSERIVATNEAGADRAVELRIYIPSEITVEHKLEIYRSSQVASTVVPPEDFQLVYQANPTSAEIAAGVMSVNDILPDDFKGAVLYTNTTQEGIAQANERPPLAVTLDRYKDYIFYGNVENKQVLLTSLISTQNLTWGTSSVTVNNGTLAETWGTMRYDTDIGGGISNCANNGAGLIRVTTTNVHQLTTGDYVRIYGVVGTVEANSTWLVTVVNTTTFDLQASAFAVAYVSGGTVDNITSRGNNIASMADNGAGKVRATTTSLHGLSTGDYVHVYSATGTPLANGIRMATVISATQFDLLDVTFVANGTATIDLYEDTGTTPRFFIHTTGTDSQNIENTAKSFVKCLNQSTDNTGWYGYYSSSFTDPPGKIQLEARTLGATAFYMTVNSSATGGNFSPAIPTSGTTYISTNDDLQNGLMYSKYNQPEHVPTSNIYYIGNRGDPILRVVALRDSLFIIKKKDGIYKLTGTSPSNFVITPFDETLECLQRNSIARGENSIFMFTNLGFVRFGDTGTEIIGRDNEFKDLQVTNNSGFEQLGYGWFYKTEKSYFCSTFATTSSTTNDIVKVYNTYTQSWHDRYFGYSTGDTNILCARIVNNLMYTAPLTGAVILRERKGFATTDYKAPTISATISSIDSTDNTIILSSGVTVPVEAEVVQTSGGNTYRKKIVAVNSTTELELDNVNNLTAAACTIECPIVSTILYQNCTCDEPDIEKEFREINLFFDNDETLVTNIDINTYSDLISTSTTTRYVPLTGTGWGVGEWGEIWGDNSTSDRIRRYIPADEHRGTSLYVEIVHKIPNEQCAICGYSVIYDSISERTKR